jgi:aspartate/methionine/tyrosine aminotransferase
MLSKLPPLHLAQRMQEIQPFYVMDLLAQARQLEAAGRSIVHLEIGEPDFATPSTIIDAGHQALRDLRTHYTPATGLPSLREAISAYYLQRFGVQVPAARIIITPGASGALQLALAVLVNPGDQVLMADPGYPCNRHFVRMFEGEALGVAVDSTTDYQLTAGHVQRYWSQKTVAAMVASPANPTGTLVSKSALQAMLDQIGTRGRLLVDEIYQGLVYDEDDYTALSLSDQVFVINSFSKYFGMTGWRLGWLVVPEEYVDAVDRLAQNIFLAPPTLSQYAALTAFSDDTQIELRRRREEFRVRRDYLVPTLKSLGFEIPVMPQGAFYIYADCSKFTMDSYAFVHAMLHQAGVAVTPGKDFGHYRPQQHVRFAYTRSIDVLEEGVKRMREFLKNN